MWKKTEETPARPPETAPQSPSPTGRRTVATIGPSITVQGDLSGEEDLLIEGRLEGEVSLKKNKVTVGKSGRVKADIYGRTIRVDGEVRGNLFGEQEVVISASGRIQGNITAPRVTLENGSKFKGSIDMEPARQARQEAAAKESAARPAPPATSPAGPPTAAQKPGEDTAGERPRQAELEPSTSRG